MARSDGAVDVPPRLIVGLAVAGALAMIGVAWLISRDTSEMVVLGVLLLAICPVGPLLIGWMAGPRPDSLGRRAVRFLVVLAWGSAWCLSFLYLVIGYRLRDDVCDPEAAEWSVLPPIPYCPPATPSAWWISLVVGLMAVPLAVLVDRRRSRSRSRSRSESQLPSSV